MVANLISFGGVVEAYDDQAAAASNQFLCNVLGEPSMMSTLSGKLLRDWTEIFRKLLYR